LYAEADADNPASGLTVVAGFNSASLSWAAVVGRVVADLLDGRDPCFDLASFRPE
jgi:glycine/D-amino acid oxidase-like deaminating enzyme